VRTNVNTACVGMFAMFNCLRHNGNQNARPGDCNQDAIYTSNVI